MATTNPSPTPSSGSGRQAPAARDHLPPKKKKELSDLRRHVRTMPIIDNHARCLADTGEKPEPALTRFFSGTPDHEDAQTSLSFYRAIKNLAKHYNCAPDPIAIETKMADLGIATRCRDAFRGVETVIFDSGGIKSAVAWDAHDSYMRTPAKRVVRIEEIGQKVAFLPEVVATAPEAILDEFVDRFKKSILEAIDNRLVVGFKSAMAYRAGLGWHFQDLADPVTKQFLTDIVLEWTRKGKASEGSPHRLSLNSGRMVFFLVQTTCEVLSAEGVKAMPIQFHTGLGDVHLNLAKATPILMDGLFRKYRKVKFVLLYAAYPFVREAGASATIHDNVWVDFGFIFPMLSRMGQQSVIQKLLEFAPSRRLLYSTNGVFLPESFLVANLQARAVLEDLLVASVRHEDLTVDQAIEIASRLFFENANNLYGLNLVLEEIVTKDGVYAHELGLSHLVGSPDSSDSDATVRPVAKRCDSTEPACCLSRHLQDNGLPATWCPDNSAPVDPRTYFETTCLFLRIGWVDYCGQLRYRVLPVSQVLKLYPDLVLTVTKAAMSLLPDDFPADDSTPTGKLLLNPEWSTLRPMDTKSTPGHFLVMARLSLPTPGGGDELFAEDPRTVLARALRMAGTKVELRVGFETEFVLYDRKDDGSLSLPKNGHAWSSSGALDPSRRACLDEIVIALEKVGIEVLMYHAESAQSQFEIVTGHQEPMAAVDTLYYVRQIIRTIAAEHGMRASLHPKPSPEQTGTAAHMHFSLKKPYRHLQEPFMAGVYKHLPALYAFGLPSVCSYLRLMDSTWCGGTWLSYGDENRETPLRRVSQEDAHWEIRCLDGTANVYLFLAALIHAGMCGVDGDPKEMRLPPPCQENPHNMTEVERQKLGVNKRAPLSLTKSVEALKKDAPLCNRIGSKVVKKFAIMKLSEVEHMRDLEKKRTPDGVKKWELERY